MSPRAAQVVVYVLPVLQKKIKKEEMAASANTASTSPYPSVFHQRTVCGILFWLSVPDLNGEAITLLALCLPGDKVPGE
ncbi:hypothetical protein Barb4_00041 [Bacteroidales bacterium Barb4]|nr:hypothetical protein Barb4_00041 [Bacteroidales bacterium Barb4]